MTSTGKLPEGRHRVRTEEQTESAFCNRAQEWQQDWQPRDQLALTDKLPVCGVPALPAGPYVAIPAGKASSP